MHAARNEFDYRVEHEPRILPVVTVGIDHPVVVFFYVDRLDKAFVRISLDVETEVQVAV